MDTERQTSVPRNEMKNKLDSQDFKSIDSRRTTSFPTISNTTTSTTTTTRKKMKWKF